MDYNIRIFLQSTIFLALKLNPSFFYFYMDVNDSISLNLMGFLYLFYVLGDLDFNQNKFEIFTLDFTSIGYNNLHLLQSFNFLILLIVSEVVKDLFMCNVRDIYIYDMKKYDMVSSI